MKKIREFVLYCAAMLGYYTIRSLPGGAVPVTARFFARIAWMVPGVSKLVCANIKCAFPDWDKKKIRGKKIVEKKRPSTVAKKVEGRRTKR